MGAMKNRILPFLFLVLIAFPVSLEAEEKIILENADYGEYKEGKTIFSGKVRVVSDDLSLDGDFLELNLATFDLLLEGEKVTLIRQEEKIEGKRLNYNLKEDSGTMEEPSTYIRPLYYKGRSVELKKERAFIIKGTRFTTCGLEKPHYEFRASKLMLRVDDKLWAKNLSLRIGRLPILYLPFYFRSLKDDCNRFSLDPGYSSKEGLSLSGKFKYCLGERVSGDLNLDWYAKGDLGKGVTFSYKSGQGNYGWIGLYHLKREDGENWKIRTDCYHILKREILAQVKFDFLKDELSQREIEKTLSPRDSELDFFVSATEIEPHLYTFRLLWERKDESTDEGFERTREKRPSLSLKSLTLKLGQSGWYYQGGLELANYFDKELCEGFRLNLNADHSLKKNLSLDHKTTLTPRLFLKGEWEKGNLSTGYQISLNLRQRFRKDLESDLTYLFGEEESKEERLKVRVRYHLPKIWAVLATSFNLRPKEEKFDPLLATISLDNKRTSLYLKALFDINGQGFSSAYGSFDYRGGKLKTTLAAVYAKADKENFYLKGSVDFPVSPKTIANALVCYNPLSGKIYEKEMNIFRDLHCLSGQLTFRQRPNLGQGGEDYQIWLRIRIKAFEGEGLFLKFQR